jgi:hypothetical protein
MNPSEFHSLKIDFESQNLSAKQFCASRGIAYGTWAYWSRKQRILIQPEQSSSFLQVLPEESPDSYTATIESPSGWRVHVSASLAEILVALPT